MCGCSCEFVGTVGGEEFTVPKFLLFTILQWLKRRAPGLPLDEILTEFNPVQASPAQPQTRVCGSRSRGETRIYLIKNAR